MKKSPILVLMIAILILPMSISAGVPSNPLENVCFMGKVTDSFGNPLQNVLVSVSTTINKERQTFETITDATGTYLYYYLPTYSGGVPCSYTLTASLEGYCAVFKNNLTIPKYEINISLNRASYFSVDSPVLFISAGQSGGIYVTSAVCDLVGIKYDWADTPEVKHIESGVGLASYNRKTDFPVQYEKNSDVPDGTQYKAIVLVMGVSLYGYISISPELVRIQKIIAWAKTNNIPIIGMHVEGVELRGRAGSDMERIIDFVAPFCDMLVTLASSNYDDKFTDIAKKHGIPLSVAPTARALTNIFEKVFIQN